MLSGEDYKKIIISSLEYLTIKGKIDVFAFVLMPSHLHFIWRINEMNGKETAQGSFLKHTAHAFKRRLKTTDPNWLSRFSVQAENKNYEFWKRDSLAIHLYTKEVAYRNLDYIHNNPCAGKWQLAPDPSGYFYSSARYYETGEKDFFFLKDLRDEF